MIESICNNCDLNTKSTVCEFIKKHKEKKCIEIKNYIIGYKEAIEDACNWWLLHDSYSKDTSFLVEEFRKYMEDNYDKKENSTRSFFRNI